MAPAIDARLGMATALTLLAVTATWSSPATVPAGAAPGDLAQPNFVFVLVDDADAKTMEYMPLTKSLVADAGATLDQFIFNQPLCCPSRATMLRGQYSQNTGVTDNEAPEGGYFAFYNKGNEASTIGTWFNDAGYSTAYVGKYLNGYARSAGLPNTHVPVGWDRWFGLFAGENYNYSYTVNEDGVITSRGSDPEDYQTDVLAGEAQRFLNSDLAASPFLMQVSVKSPHAPAVPAIRHKNLFSSVKYPQTPAFNEKDVRDKPGSMNKLKKLTSAQIQAIDVDFRNKIRSLQAVDEMVADIVATLEAQGKLANTYILLTTDNGFHMGEHRLLRGKNTPYEEDLRVPLYIRGPGIAPGQTVTEMVGNVDLAPTLADAADITAPDFVDGRSFLPLLNGGGVQWRNSYLIGRGGPNSFAGVRTEQYTYVEYASGEGEFYDRAADPYELENSFTKMPSDLRTALHNRLEELRTCSRDACRTAEAAPLAPAA